MIKDFFSILLPQATLVLFIFIQLICGMFIQPNKYKIARFISLFGIVLTICMLSTVQIEPQYFGLKNSIMSDSYTLLFHFIILLCGFFVTLLSENLVNATKKNAFIFHSILLTAILGAMCIICSNDFLTLFISLELLSFPTYFLIATANGYYSKEASFKYLITNAVSTAIFLLGVSYLYGITETLNFQEIYEIIISAVHTPLFAISGILIVLGLISKLAVFPFANWVIDVYKGSESSVLAFLSTIPKLALFGILCRLIIFPLGGTFELTAILIIISLITALWANSYAIREKNIKSILACSTAANSSYILLAASIISVYNLSTVIFYLICYVIMNITAFGFINITESSQIESKLKDFIGLAKKNLFSTICYTIAIIGLAGFPITSGFIAKIYLFSAIAHSGLIFLPFLIALLILTVIALYYYLKLIKPLFENNNNNIKLNTSFSQKLVLIITTTITILIGLYPEKIIEICRLIAYNI